MTIIKCDELDFGKLLFFKDGLSTYEKFVVKYNKVCLLSYIVLNIHKAQQIAYFLKNGVMNGKFSIIYLNPFIHLI